ncbi:MAG: histidinol-phosphate transaminase [Prevotellaceae bacterium]|jgi:histidinol-phosphate aminotransferase|nr:histidinol-phosphate transaminase [Prevotellaceae bacterium]
MVNIENLVRENIKELKPYSTARDEFVGVASVFLDANESPYNAPYNRYPDPMQWELKRVVAAQKGVAAEQILLGNGSDEPIDLLIRAFCEPKQDNIVAIAPTYGMYKVAADVNNVEYRKAPLNAQLDFCADELLQAADEHTKLIWLCSPNNPTGNSLNRREIVKTIEAFAGIVVLDEAYIDFSEHKTFLQELNKYPNLVVLQTFSKAWASAGVRLGMAFAAAKIIAVLNKIKYPYNINVLTQRHALQHILQHEDDVKAWVKTLLAERKKLCAALAALPCVLRTFPTDANFILVKVADANAMYRHLAGKGVVVRNRHNVERCEDCLRITVGTPEENAELIAEMKTVGSAGS